MLNYNITACDRTRREIIYRPVARLGPARQLMLCLSTTVVDNHKYSRHNNIFTVTAKSMVIKMGCSFQSLLIYEVCALSLLQEGVQAAI